MLQYIRDRLSTAGLKARYEKMVHEKLVELTESQSPQPVAEDPGEWTLLNGGKSVSSEPVRAEVREQVRKLVRENPHACQILRLLESYVTGPGLQLNHQVIGRNEKGPGSEELLRLADRLWKEFCSDNQSHYSFSEHARRTWRDGESFIRKFESDSWPPPLRFIDPESIAPTADEPDSQGIITEPHDVETPVEYIRHLGTNSHLVERIPARQILQTRIGVDSNEKRGVSIFAPLVEPLNCFSRWLETELLARKLQSSIVLWRKVQGSPQMAGNVADQAPGLSSDITGMRRERFSPGTILTTNHGTDIQFLQPNTNFGDAVSLGRAVLLSIAAGAGLPEFMLTSDASNSNFASTMVAEGPAVKFFQSQQQFFAHEFDRLWKWVMQEAIEQGLLPVDFFDRVETKWSFPPLINRDRPRERMADVRLVEQGILSRAEIARRDGVDPAMMQNELKNEKPGIETSNTK